MNEPHVANSGERPLVAYFCMEFGLESNFKIYSGGLGILAGDLIKAARDADYPMVAVGILWRQGYTVQTIGDNSFPIDSFPEYRYPYLEDTGAVVSVKIKEADVRCKVWLCECFSNIKLYLLDAFLPDNPEMLVTGQLYGWFEEERLAQEIILGVGGVRALDALGIKPDVYHFNEGHAVLAGLELINIEMATDGAAGAAGITVAAAAAADTATKATAAARAAAATQQKSTAKATAAARAAAAAIAAAAPTPITRRERFAAAWERVRERIVFTTHTPVPAGNESHGFRAMFYVGADLGFSKNELRRIGGEPFNMTVAGLRLSRGANAVAELHAETANIMWAGVNNAASIIPITNGVHNGTWQDVELAEAVKLFGATGADIGGGTGDAVYNAAAKYIWSRHTVLKNDMLQGVYERSGVQLDRDRLTVGFARRAAPYKRSDLIFSDEERIDWLLCEGKLQIIFSGKAHPNDLTGKQIVSNLVRMAARYPKCVVFLENYDMAIGAMLTRGCDIWLNNPKRPQEASGTSGMKAAMNGVLNFSVLDGWWPEGCEHGVNGWQMGGAYQGDDHERVDAESLYEVLTNEIIPTFYDDRIKWVGMMVKSIEMSQYAFSAARMLDDYHKKL
ncbi:MAG: alpha-glucan family phosphorylase, partial [Oscillospiraceae bacterium]|nr:alpha-glucan family phosphorylase [Oscillospiraceae bacterium]